MKFEIGSPVLVKPSEEDDFTHEFLGTVVDFNEKKNLYVVEDQDSDFFDVDEGQLTLS